MTKTLFPDAVITGEMLRHLRLPNVERYELVEGRIEVLTPTNRFHAEATVRIAALLSARMPGYRILAGDPGVYVRRRPDTVRGPDVLAVSEARYAQNEDRAFLTVTPELVVEITSPSNEAEDTLRKVVEYLGLGCQTIWLVDVEALTVTVTGGSLAGTVLCAGPRDELILPNGESVRLEEVVR